MVVAGVGRVGGLRAADSIPTPLDAQLPHHRIPRPEPSAGAPQGTACRVVSCHYRLVRPNLTRTPNRTRTRAVGQKVNRNEGPIVCTPETELQEAIGTMLVNNIHRLFVVDEARKPVSVLTYGDIISRLTA